MAFQPIEHLFREALEVVNRSLESHRGVGEQGTLEARERFLDGHQTKVLVYDDDPSAPFAAFAVEYREGRLEMVPRWQSDVDSEWSVSRAYLSALITHPDDGAEHPALLDVYWVAGRVPATVSSRRASPGRPLA